MHDVSDAADVSRCPFRRRPTILGPSTAQDASGDSPMGIRSIDRATQNLVQWAARGEWEPLQQEFCAAHFEPVTDGVDLPDDALVLTAAKKRL